jgi:hypothetical protein
MRSLKSLATRAADELEDGWLKRLRISGDEIVELTQTNPTVLGELMRAQAEPSYRPAVLATSPILRRVRLRSRLDLPGADCGARRSNSQCHCLTAALAELEPTHPGREQVLAEAKALHKDAPKEPTWRKAVAAIKAAPPRQSDPPKPAPDASTH